MFSERLIGTPACEYSQALSSMRNTAAPVLLLGTLRLGVSDRDVNLFVSNSEKHARTVFGDDIRAKLAYVMISTAVVHESAQDNFFSIRRTSSR